MVFGATFMGLVWVLVTAIAVGQCELFSDPILGGGGRWSEGADGSRNLARDIDFSTEHIIDEQYYDCLAKRKGRCPVRSRPCE